MQGINNNGTVVGTFTANNGGISQYGYTYTNGIFTTLQDPSSDRSTAPVGINDNGTVVGDFTANNAFQGFIEANGIYTTLDLPGINHGASGINDNGVIVGGFYNGVNYGFVATPTAAVPEPSTLAPFGFGLLGLAGLRWMHMKRETERRQRT